VLEETAGRGADVIYDSVGGDVFERSLKCIAWNGRLLVIGFAGGEIPSVKLNRILLKNIAVVGLHWGAYAKFEPARIPETMRALLDLYGKGALRPEIYRSYPLAEASAALVALGSRKTWGKVVLQP
jgi:NADPH2:quinone reductase